MEYLTTPVLIAAALAALGTYWLLLLLFGDYRLGRHEVEVLLFDRVVRHVPLYEIDDVLVGARFPCEIWPARGLFRRRFLSIRKKRGLFRYLVICPKRPERLRENIYFALGWNPHAQGTDGSGI